MAKRRSVRTLSDAMLKARAISAKPSRVSLIVKGIKYRAGQAPARVCPVGRRIPAEQIGEPAAEPA